MALTATLGASNANSYVTVEEANAYFEDRMHASSWDELDEEVKSSLLVTSSQMLDWYVKWKGLKATSTQSMAWPRTDVILPDGSEIDDDVLPLEVKTASFEQAFSNMEADRMADDPLAGIGQLQAGSLMIKAGAEKPNQTNAQAVPDNVQRILKDLSGFGGTVWLLRA